jgi:hypothetical protein
MELWSQENGADLFIDLAESPIPIQLISGAKGGRVNHVIYIKLNNMSRNKHDICS